MPPQRTQISCPRCRQPILAQIEQLFDVSSDPGAKQRLLGGVSNYAVCQACGYNGPLATPIVYHDADKELLLIYFPPELNIPVNEQEKLIGPLITQVTNKLQPEKRKGYLLRPQSFLTYQSMLERILGADGITPEMIQGQQKRVSLIEKLLTAPTPEARSELIKSESALLDADFFALFNRLLEGAASSGQEQTMTSMDALQKQLLAESDYGRKISSQANEVQEAVKTLQAAGKELTREKLMEILIEAPNDDRLSALVSLVRPGLDYLFFQSLTERLDTQSGKERIKLEDLRTKLLDLTQKIDKRIEEEFKQAGDLLNTILAAKDIQAATAEHLGQINDAFIQLLNRKLQEANQKNDAELMPKLQQVVAVLQKASAPPPEIALLEELLTAPDESSLEKMLQEHAAEITSEFSSIVASVLSRNEGQKEGQASSEEAQLTAKLERIYRAVLKKTMKQGLNA